MTAGLGASELAAAYEKKLDDYDAIIVKALADRLAEVFAEHLRERARRDWGHGADEDFTNDDLIDERHRKNPPRLPEGPLLQPRPRRPRPDRGLRPRKGITVAEVEKWISPILAYDRPS